MRASETEAKYSREEDAGRLRRAYEPLSLLSTDLAAAAIGCEREAIQDDHGRKVAVATAAARWPHRRRCASRAVLLCRVRGVEAGQSSRAGETERERGAAAHERGGASSLHGYDGDRARDVAVSPRPRGMADSEDAEQEIRRALDVVQSMIDISADRLEGLRTQCSTSAELTQQEIRTLEVTPFSCSYPLSWFNHPVNKLTLSAPALHLQAFLPQHCCLRLHYLI